MGGYPSPTNTDYTKETEMTDNNQIELSREDWLTEAIGFIFDDIIAPHMPDDWQPPQVRVSVGFTGARKNKDIAVCYKKEAAADKINQIYVTPERSNSSVILEHLIIAAMHAVDDCASGRKGAFARLARAVGFEGPLTTPRVSDALGKQRHEIRALLGSIPHSKLDLAKAKPKQSTRMIKVECKACGFHFRTSQTQIDHMLAFRRPDNNNSCTCPACDSTGLHVNS